MGVPGPVGAGFVSPCGGRSHHLIEFVCRLCWWVHWRKTMSKDALVSRPLTAKRGPIHLLPPNRARVYIDGTQP
jgi:hypothetical protein